MKKLALKPGFKSDTIPCDVILGCMREHACMICHIHNYIAVNTRAREHTHTTCYEHYIRLPCFQNV